MRNLPFRGVARAERVDIRPAGSQPAGMMHRSWSDLHGHAAYLVPPLTFAGCLFLTLNHSYVAPLIAHLHHLRWWPLVLLVYVATALTWAAGRLPREIKAFDLAALGFIGFAALSAVYSGAPLLTLGRTASVALLYFAVFWGVWAGTDLVGERLIAKCVVAAGAAAIVTNVATLPLQDLTSALQGNRFRGFFQSPNTVGLLAAFLMPLALWQVVEQRTKRHWGITALLASCLLASQSRTGLLAALVGSGYVLVAAFPTQKRMVAGVLLAYAAASVIIMQMAFAAGDVSPRWPWVAILHSASLEREISSQPEPLLEQLRANPRNVDYANLGGRLWVWREGVKYLAEHPWRGFGFGVEEHIMSLHGFHEATYGNRFHNSFLGIALQLGLPGLLLFYAPLVGLYFREQRAAVRYAQAPLRVALRGVCLAALVAACFESWIYSVGNALTFPFWTSIMLLVRLNEPSPGGAVRPLS